MIPVAQTIFGTPDSDAEPGNCIQAALASLLDLPLADVPHFVGDHWRTNGDLDWLTEMGRWLLGRGLRLTEAEPAPGEYYLAFGPSPRDPARLRHVAVYRDGALAHDPHPDGTGLAYESGRWVVRPIGRDE